MSQVERDILELELESIWAEEMLQNRAGELSADAIYDLIMLSTGDKRRAEKERNLIMLKQMQAGQAPG